MKKQIAFFLSLLMLLMILPVSAAAENVPTFALGSASAKAGEAVQIPVTISDNSGIAALKIMISYDANVLTFNGATDSQLFSGGDALFGNDLTANPYNLLWIDSLSTTNYTTNGTFAVLNFTIKENAAVGDTTVSIAYEKGSTFDVDLKEVNFATQNGTVTVQQNTPGGWRFVAGTGFGGGTMRIMETESGNSYIVGMDDWLPMITDSVECFGGWSYEVIANDQGMESTGAQLVIKDETGTEVERYTVVLYGDVNGDGTIDISDIAEISLAVDRVGLTDWEDYWFPDDYAASMAADVNHDLTVDLSDIAILLAYYYGDAVINQGWASDADPLYL